LIGLGSVDPKLSADLHKAKRSAISTCCSAFGRVLGVKRSHFKYVSKREHADALLAGKVFHQTLGYFRDYEDLAAKQVIGDELESTHIFRPKDGLQINNQTRGTSFALDAGLESSVRGGEIYVFCLSLGMTEELIREFRAEACVEILNPRAFIKRWEMALLSGAVHFAKRVSYYEREDVPENVWPEPELIATMKLAQFDYQEEFRCGFSTTGALDYGQCNWKLVDRKTRPSRKPEEHLTMTRDLGDLSDLCKLHLL
jgi:hypothetical protein